MHRRTFIPHLLTTVSMPFVLSACFASPPLVVGIHPWIGYESLFLAREFNWLPDKVILHESKTVSDSLAALQAGTLDAAALTLDEVLLARAASVSLTVILVFNVSAGADMLLVRPNIKTLADLQGMRVGFEQSALGALIMSKVLETAELRLQNIKILDVPPDQQVAAWLLGEIDALITYEPTASLLLQEGAKRLFDSRQMPDTIFDVLAVRRDRLWGRDMMLRALLVAHFRVLHHLRINRQDAVYRIAARQNVCVDVVRQALAGVILPGWVGNHRYLADKHHLANALLLETAHTLNTLMVRHDLLAQPDSLTALFDSRFLPRKEVDAW